MTGQVMPGIHAYWAAPKLREAARQGWDETDLRDFPVLPTEELITAVFSALTWQKLHGPVTLFADSRTIEFLDQHGVLPVYDAVRHAEVDGIDQQRFDPQLYFSLVKFVALGASRAPVAIVDLDLFPRAPLPPFCAKRFLFAHFETLGCEVYPPFADLPNPNRVELPGWTDDLPACNTALAVFTSQAHLDHFVGLAMAFMVDNNDHAPLHPGARPMFAEQRLAPYTALRHGMALTPLTNSVWDTGRAEWTQGAPEDVFHHTWHRKRYFSRQTTRDRYCAQLVGELLHEFPHADRFLERDPALARYVDSAQARTAPA
jgi:hypothetical protein